MEKYLIVRVPDATTMLPAVPVVENGRIHEWPTTNMARIGKAVRLTSEEHFLGASWMTTHDKFGLMTDEESETIAKIFENVSARAKKRNPKKFQR
jgi:hypothetical protein